MAIGTTAAIIGSSLIGAGASAMAGKSQNKAINQATQSSEQAAREQNALAERIYNQQRADNEPFRQGGLTGQQEYMRMLGLDTQNYAGQQQQHYNPISPFNSLPTGGAYNPTQLGYEAMTPVGGYGAQGIQDRFPMMQDGGAAYLAANPDVAADPYFAANPMAHYQQYGQNEGRQWSQPASQFGGASDQQQSNVLKGYTGQEVTDKLRATPGYQFAFGEGQRALDASATARGSTFSGSAMKALTKYGQGVADQQYGDHMNRLANLAGMGQTASNNNASYAQNYGNQVGNNLGNLANARASGLQAKAQANSNMWNGIAGFGGWGLSNLGGLK